MAKLSKYDIAKRLILSGDVKTLPILLEVLDKTPFSKDAKTTPKRFERLLSDPTMFRFADVYNMASVLGVDHKIILNMVDDYCIGLSKKPGKKR
jgi:hypothetical protein